MQSCVRRATDRLCLLRFHTKRNIVDHNSAKTEDYTHMTSSTSRGLYPNEFDFISHHLYANTFLIQCDVQRCCCVTELAPLAMVVHQCLGRVVLRTCDR